MLSSALGNYNQNTIPAVDGKKHFDIDVQDLTKGLYIIQIYTDENIVAKKFIKE